MMANTIYTVAKTANRFAAFIGIDTAATINVPITFNRSGTNDFIPDGSATGQSAFSVPGPTANIKLKKVNAYTGGGTMKISFGGTSNKDVIIHSGLGHGDLEYGYDGEPSVGGDDLPAGFTGTAVLSFSGVAPKGYAYLEFFAG
tara:strand:+ start:38 stop:469 length:432 start_codon:yes stop_codon:yes gene_type:complete